MASQLIRRKTVPYPVCCVEDWSRERGGREGEERASGGWRRLTGEEGGRAQSLTTR